MRADRSAGRVAAADALAVVLGGVWVAGCLAILGSLAVRSISFGGPASQENLGSDAWLDHHGILVTSIVISAAALTGSVLGRVARNTTATLTLGMMTLLSLVVTAAVATGNPHTTAPTSTTTVTPGGCAIYSGADNNTCPGG